MCVYLCCVCVCVVCTIYYAILSNTHYWFCEGNETCPRVFFLSSRSNLLPKYFRLEQQGFVFNLIPHAYYTIFFSNRCTTLISYYIYMYDNKLIMMIIINLWWWWWWWWKVFYFRINGSTCIDVMCRYVYSRFKWIIHIDMVSINAANLKYWWNNDYEKIP